MFRLISISTLGLAAIMTLNAGQIYIGTGANGINGLTTASGAFATTVTGTNVAAGKYTGSLFVGATGITSVNNPAIVGTNVAPPNGNQAGGEVVAGGGTTFALVDNSIISAGAITANDFAGANSFGAGTVVSTFNIPINIFGVNSIDTMLNDVYGISGASDVTVAFNFTDASHVALASPLTYSLVNGIEIRSAEMCTGVGTGGGGSTFTDGGGAGGSGSCTNYASTLNTSNRYGINGSTVAGVGAPSVSAFNVYTGTYANNTQTFGAAGATFANTKGNIFLDGQNFNFGGLYTSDYLASITITSTDTNLNPSRLVLSAISVDTPEPSSIALLFTGLGALGFYRRKRRVC